MNIVVYMIMTTTQDLESGKCYPLGESKNVKMDQNQGRNQRKFLERDIWCKERENLDQGT